MVGAVVVGSKVAQHNTYYHGLQLQRTDVQRFGWRPDSACVGAAATADPDQYFHAMQIELQELLVPDLTLTVT